jgi:lysophospholipase L1-like esterase
LIIRVLVLAILVVVAVSCSGTTVQPTPIDDPVVSCPADITVTQHGSQPPTVSFDTPAASKGTAPVTVTCTPSSGTPFQSGTTTVKCEAIDSRQHKGSCSFSVIINVVPQLLKTKFMAFGDSLTEGKNGGIVVVPGGIFNTPISYVEQLSVKLSTRYSDQTVTVIAEGKGDEEAGQGKLRLPGALSTYSPEALLLLEGVNDLLHTTDPTKLPAATNSIIDALRTMIVAARSRGIKVYVGTLTPLSPTRQTLQAAVIPDVNARIRALASQEGAVFVDLNAAITLDLVGADGIHLTAQGYSVVADTWMQAIISTLEAPSSIQ